MVECFGLISQRALCLESCFLVPNLRLISLRALRAFVVNIFIKKVIFLLNILGQFGIITVAIEMAGI